MPSRLRSLGSRLDRRRRSVAARWRAWARSAGGRPLDRFSVNPERQTETRLFSAGLLSVAAVAVTQFICLPALSPALWVSLAAFAVAIPMLAFTLWVTHYRGLHRFTVEPRYELGAEALGQAAAVAGVVGLFWHFSALVALLFLLASAVAFAFHLRFRVSTRHANR